MACKKKILHFKSVSDSLHKQTFLDLKSTRDLKPTQTGSRNVTEEDSYSNDLTLVWKAVNHLEYEPTTSASDLYT